MRRRRWCCWPANSQWCSQSETPKLPTPPTPPGTLQCLPTPPPLLLVCVFAHFTVDTFSETAMISNFSASSLRISCTFFDDNDCSHASAAVPSFLLFSSLWSPHHCAPTEIHNVSFRDLLLFPFCHSPSIEPPSSADSAFYALTLVMSTHHSMCS